MAVNIHQCPSQSVLILHTLKCQLRNFQCKFLPNVLTFSCSEVGSNCISPDSFMVHVTAQTRHFIGNPASTIAIQAAFIAHESNLTIKESHHVFFQSVKTKVMKQPNLKGWLFKQILTKAAVKENIGPPDLFPSVLFQEGKFFSSSPCCFHKTIHNNWHLDKSAEQTVNSLKHRFVKHWLNSV